MKNNEDARGDIEIVADWLRSKIQELSANLGGYAYELNDRRQKLEETEKTIDRLKAKAAALEAEIEQYEDVIRANQTALDFVSNSLDKAGGAM